MRVLRVIFGAIASLAATSLSATAGELSSAFVRAPVEETSISSEAIVWFEKGLALDLGVSDSPSAPEAFAAMRRAADAGHSQAAFNVAAMLDSGRGVSRDLPQAAIWYARAAARGSRRAAFNLGQLYEKGEGVPINVDLSRAWYTASGLPAARGRLVSSKTYRPHRLQAPEPLWPQDRGELDAGLRQAEFVWTVVAEPEAVRYFVELRTIDSSASQEVWSGFVDVSSVRLPIPAGARKLAWRVSAVAAKSGDYEISSWSNFAAR